MNTTLQGVVDTLAHTPDLCLAAASCRTLIRAYHDSPEHVDWSDVDMAFVLALEAFGISLESDADPLPESRHDQ